MPLENSHDSSRDNIDVWYWRLVKFVRVGGFWLDMARSMFVVLAGVLIGALAGGIIAANFWPDGFWVATISGALLLGTAAWKVARRVFLGDQTELAVADVTSSQRGALFAPHMPGVPERFALARKREFVLSLALIPSALFLAYLYKAEPDWPVADFLPRNRLAWATPAFIVVIFGLIVLNGRCPACRHRIRGLVRLRRCPGCGIALRDRRFGDMIAAHTHTAVRNRPFPVKCRAKYPLR